MKILTYIFVCLACGFASLGLWGMLNLLDHISLQTSKALPAFTTLMISLRGWIFVAPLLILACAIYQVCRGSGKGESVAAFLGCSLSAICLVAVPAMIALFLPCVVLMEQTWTK